MAGEASPASIRRMTVDAHANDEREERIRPDEARSLEMPGGPPPGWRQSPLKARATEGGQREDEPSAGQVLLGRYVRRSRYLMNYSQERMEDISGVSQTAISRLETGRSAGMRIDSLVRLADSFGRTFPLGFCPHDHPCPWQPIRLPPPIDGERLRIRQLLIDHGLDYARPGMGD
jgi:transcriptional regulator with XRE-family HTH domain